MNSNSTHRMIARIELFQRLVLMLMLGVIPLIVDPDVLASFVDTKYLLIQLLILFLLVAGAFKLALGGLRPRFSWISVFFLLLFGCYFSHARTDPAKDYALISALKYGLLLLLPLIYVSAFKKRRHQDAAETFLVLMTLPMMLYAIAQYLNYELFEYLFEVGKSNVQGTLGNSHFLGGYLAIYIFFLWNRIRQVRVGKQQLFYIFLLVIAVFLLIVSQSRGAMLCVGLAGFWYLGLQSFIGWIRNRNRFRLAILVSWLAIWFIVPGMIWLGGRYSESNPIRKVELKIHRDLSLNNRIMLAMISLKMWEKNLVWGVGLDRYPAEYSSTLFELGEKEDNVIFLNLIRQMESTQANEAHNDFLQSLAETGIVGYSLLATICGLYLVGLGTLLRQKRIKLDRRDLILTGCLSLALLTIIAQMIYSFPLHLPANSLLVFLVFGWMSILFRKYGVWEVERPQWMFHRAVRWILALALILFSAWGSYTVLRQYVGLVYLRLGYQVLGQYRNPQGAMELFVKAGILYPENGEVSFCKAQVYAQDQDQLRKALSMLEEAERTFSNSSIRLVKSQLYLEMFRYSEALKVLEPLSQVTLRLEKLHLAQGMVYYHDGDFTQAVKEFEQELEINPKSENALLYLAQSHFNLGNYYRAEETFLKAYNKKIKSIEVCERLGDIYAEHHFRPKKARIFYTQALNWAIESNRGQDIRRLERKIEKLEKKIRLKMENPIFRSKMQS